MPFAISGKAQEALIASFLVYLCYSIFRIQQENVENLKKKNNAWKKNCIPQIKEHTHKAS